MAVSSLNKMSVVLDNNQTSTSQGLLMPKLKYRFRVTFENFGVTTPRSELTKQVIDFTRPNLTHTDIPVHVYNSLIHLAGKHEWGDVSVTLRDDATGAVQKLVGEQMQKQFDHMEQSSAASGIDYKFTMRCEMLDGGNGAYEPTVLETWEMYGCYVSGVDYGNLDYAASEPVTIGMTIKIDNAVQTPLSEGIGASVGRTLGDVTTG
jgi:hypothetical protein